MEQLTQGIIDAAIEGFESQKKRIDEQIAELRALSNGNAPAVAVAPKKRGMSAAGRKAIAEAQRKRWAAAKGQAETKAPIVAKPVKKKRVLSAAGKAAIVAALKKCLAIERESQAQCLGRLFFACSLQAMASASGAEKGPGEK